MPFSPDHPLMVPNPTPTADLPASAPRAAPTPTAPRLAPHPTGVELAAPTAKHPSGIGNNHGKRGSGKRRAAQLSSAHLAMWLRENVPSSEICAFLGGLMRGVDIYAPKPVPSPDGVPQAAIAFEPPTIAERMAAAKLMLDRQLGSLEDAAELNRMVAQTEAANRRDRPNLEALDDEELAEYRRLQRKMLAGSGSSSSPTTPGAATVVDPEDVAGALEGAKQG